MLFGGISGRVPQKTDAEMEICVKTMYIVLLRTPLRGLRKLEKRELDDEVSFVINHWNLSVFTGAWNSVLVFNNLLK